MPETSGWKKLVGGFRWNLSLDALRKKLTKGLEVRVDQPETARGGHIDALVVVTEPDALGALEAGLVCKEYYDEKVYDSDGHASRTTSDAIAHEQWQPLQNLQGEQSVRFAIPPSAPFSYEGSCVSFKWEVVARGRKQHALDARASHEISVRA